MDTSLINEYDRNRRTTFAVALDSDWAYPSSKVDLMSDETIRSFQRGLDVLKVLNRTNYLTALEVSRAVALPRPTVYRVLETLMKAGYVTRDEVTDVYSLTERVVDLACGYSAASHAIEVAKPLVKAFSEGICWPAYLHVREGNAMVTRAIFRSPRSLGYPRIGKRHPLAGSAPGRAFLASLPPDERSALMRDLVNVEADAAGEEHRLELRQLSQLVRDAEVLGCGFRDGGIVPRTCSIALPIVVNGGAVAYWTIVMMRSVLSVNRAISTYLDDARGVVQEIEAIAGRSKAESAVLH
jgi:DNA-binding IclR family transcriptional regulator